MNAAPTALLLAIMLAGCASGGHCVGEFDYQKAQNLPPAKPVEGLRQGDSGATLRIPPEPAQKVAFAEPYTDPEDPAKQKYRCLDLPPRLVEPPAAPAAAEFPASAEPAKTP
jgi:hypothetical protein